MSDQIDHVQSAEQYNFYQHQNHPRVPAANDVWGEAISVSQIWCKGLITHF